MTTQESFHSFPFLVAHLLVKAWLCFPNLLQSPFCFGFPFGQTATGLLVDLGLPRLRYSGSRKNSSLCCFTLPFAESLSPWRSHLGLRRSCHNHLGILLLASVPYISPPANLLLPLSGELSPFLQGFQPSFPQEMIFSVSPQKPRRKGLSFIIGHSVVWE